MRHAKATSGLAAVVVLVAASAAAFGAELRYSVVELGRVDGVPVYGRALNGLGEVGGWVALPQADGTTASRPIISRGGQIQQLPLVPNAVNGFVGGLNDRGQAAMGYDFAGGVSRPYLYNGTGTPQPIALPAGYTSGYATSINNLGHVAGTLIPAAGGPAPGPFVYADGVMSVLPLPAGAVQAIATDFNDRGDVLGASYTTDPGTEPHVTVWSGGTVTELAPPAGWSRVRPREINNLGHVLGWAELMDAEGRTISRRPVIYRGGVPTVLVNGFGTADSPNGFNDVDAIVGGALGNIYSFGYVYEEGVGMTDLSGLAPLPDGFSIVQARAINNVGQILADAQNRAGENRSYLLTPVPEPAAAAVALGLGAAALLARRRQRGRLK